ncbi:MAG: hypothetical protein GYB66_05255 [Chloroflexi bacterium]|nr:hypothetical protein [Chloroflexota bacterium]
MRLPLRLGMIIVILLLASFWRFHELGAQSLWHDEGNSLRLAERNITDLIEATSLDIHPPGYYLALKVWIAGVGKSEFGLRSLSALWGIISVAATFALGKRLFGPLAALIAAFLVAASPFAIYYSQEARMYAQLSAMSILSLWILLRFLNAAKRSTRYQALIPWGIGLAIVNLLGLYTQYTYPFTILVQGLVLVWWWLRSGDNHSMVAYIGFNALTLLLFLPWLPTAYDQVTTWPSTGDTTDLLDRLDRIFTILVYGQTAGDLSPLQVIVPFALVVTSLLVIRRLAWHQALLKLGLPAALITFTVGALLVSGAYRETNLKFLLPAQSALALLIGAGASQLVGLDLGQNRGIRLAQIAAGAGAILLIIVPVIGGIVPLYSDPAYARSDYHGIANTIEANRRANDAIILTAPNQQEVFSYYYNGTAPVFPLPRGLGGDDAATRQATQDVVDQYSYIYLVLWGQRERDPNNVVQTTLDQSAYVVERRWYNDVELVEYAVLESPPDSPDKMTNVAFGEVIRLVGFVLSNDTFATGRGDVLGVTLFWETDATLDKRYKVSVQLLQPDGTLATQHDSEPANGRAITTTWQPGETIVDNHGLVVDEDLQAGTYTLVVIVYNLANPDERLQPATNDPNQVYTLAAITLEQPQK